MAIKGITYDNQGPAAADHGEFWRSGFSDGVLSGCEISYLGADVTISAGRIVSAGRLSRLSAAETIAIGATEGVARIVYQTDLSQVASRTEFKQLSFVVQLASSADALPDLIQEDINNGGIIYQMEFCRLQLGGPGVSSIISRAPKAMLSARSLYSPWKIVSGVSSYDITVEDLGQHIRCGWGETIAFNLTQENSAEFPDGGDLAIYNFSRLSGNLTIVLSGVVVRRQGEGSAVASGSTLAIPEPSGMIALKKIRNEEAGDLWLLIGDVEVVS